MRSILVSQMSGPNIVAEKHCRGPKQNVQPYAAFAVEVMSF